MTNIIVADATMSLDNVLAVAGAARDHLEMLIFGLVLSIALMALTANFIAKLLEKHNWLGYLGLAIIAYVAVQMIWQGSGSLSVDQRARFLGAFSLACGIRPARSRSGLPRGFARYCGVCGQPSGRLRDEYRAPAAGRPASAAPFGGPATHSWRLSYHAISRSRIRRLLSFREVRCGA